MQVTAAGFFISAHRDNHEAIKCMPNSPLRSINCIFDYPNLLSISIGIPMACLKAKVAIFQNWKKFPTYEKSVSLWNQTWDLQYYTSVNNPSNKYACGKLVGCLTYHKWVTIWYLCKQRTTPWNAICCGILLSASYIVYLIIIISMCTVVICICHVWRLQ